MLYKTKKQGNTMIKNFILPVAAVVTMGTFAVAESYPAEGPQSHSAMYGSDSSSAYADGAYVGFGYSYMSIDTEMQQNRDLFDFDFTGNAITFLGGYSFNNYLALEGRYSMTMGDLSLDASSQGVNSGVDFDGDMQNIALYLKPMYSTPKLAIYGLLGYGQFEMDIDGFNEVLSESALQWGLGMSFNGGEHLNIYIDYIRLYSEDDNSLFEDYSSNLTVDTFNAGLTYKF